MDNKFISITLPAQYVRFHQDATWQGKRLHETQAIMLDILENTKQVLIMTAPTGTGKSRSFPLPLAKKKLTVSLADYRGMIICPTNALIKDMFRQYKGTDERQGLFEELTINEINSIELNKRGVTGGKRWTEILNIIRESDLIITNPDILNWAFAGGYSFHKHQDQVIKIFSDIDYFVFDEYHIYDEEQIANIVSWMLFARFILGENFKTKKFVFASATPEPTLKTILEQYKFSVETIAEEILHEPSPQYRPIKGKIKVIFKESVSPDEGVKEYLLEKPELKSLLQKGYKGLAIFDNLKTIRQSLSTIKANFGEFAIAEESGYINKNGKKEEKTSAHLVIATNKVEVGVNLDVRFCLMPTGKYIANFIQRLGRVARADKDGKVHDGAVVVFTDNITKLKNCFLEGETISYYDFIEKVQSSGFLRDKKLHIESIPRFMGAYFFIMRFKTLKNWGYQKEFDNNFILDTLDDNLAKAIYCKMRNIHFIIKKLKEDSTTNGFNYPTKCIRDWWKAFCQTFQFFRNSSITVSVIDKDMNNYETEYSLEWLLNYREVVAEIKREDKNFYEVSGFRESKPDLQYINETFPLGLLNEGNRYLSQKDKRMPNRVYQVHVKSCIKEWERKPTIFHKKVTEMLIEAEILWFVFSTRRWKLSGIAEISCFL